MDHSIIKDNNLLLQDCCKFFVKPTRHVRDFQRCWLYTRYIYIYIFLWGPKQLNSFFFWNFCSILWKQKFSWSWLKFFFNKNHRTLWLLHMKSFNTYERRDKSKLDKLDRHTFLLWKRTILLTCIVANNLTFFDLQRLCLVVYYLSSSSLTAWAGM